MIVTYLDEGEIYMVEPASDEERLFIQDCPQEWSWLRVLSEWERNQREAA